MATTHRYRGLLIAVGHQSRVGKDTFADFVTAACAEAGAQAYRVAIAGPLYNLAEHVQEFMRKPVEKNPQLLQGLGQLMRSCYGDDIWINIAVARIQAFRAQNPDCVIVVTDMRMPNEMRMLQLEGFTTVKISRRGRAIDRDPNHITEVALKDAEFDYHIENDGTIDEYRRDVLALLDIIAAAASQ